MDSFRDTDIYLSDRLSSRANFILKNNSFNENHYYDISLFVSDGVNIVVPSVRFKIANSKQSHISDFGEAAVTNSIRF